jgi:hypothetical protein
MPLQNRVTPFGTLIATPERGMLMGNRGCLHNDRRQIKRNYQLQRWIICVLEFRGRHRTVMKPGHYTELFFLDEATALAAGHRPCAECQRPRFNLFRETWAVANPELTSEKRPAAPLIDACLHKERLNGNYVLDRWQLFKTLPNGAFITFDEVDAYLVLNGKLFRWTPAGYEKDTIPKTKTGPRVLAPPSIVKALEAGYPVDIHGSAC